MWGGWRHRAINACLKIIEQAVPQGACNGARLGADPSCAPLVASRLYNTMKPQSFWWFSFASPSLGRADSKQHHGDAQEGIRGAGGARTSGLRTSALSVQQIGEAFRLHSLQTNLLKPPENDPCLFPTPSLQHAEDKSLSMAQLRRSPGPPGSSLVTKIFRRQ